MLRAAHSVMRQTFATLMAVLRAGEWRDGSAWSHVAAQFDAVPCPAQAVYQLDEPAPGARRWPESPTRFQNSGFMLDGQLVFDRGPRFRGAFAVADSQVQQEGGRA